MVQFDFDSIKNRLIERLRTKESWKNILFFSTNSRIIDVFAEELEYCMQMNEIYSTECKWTLAKQRSSIMSEVQFFNYYPYRKIGATGFVRVSTSSTFNSSYPRMIPILKYSEFSTSSGITVLCSETTNIPAGVNYVDIPVVQGTYKSQTFLATGIENESFKIINPSVENFVFDVYVNNELYTVISFIRESSSGLDKVCTVTNINDFSGIIITFGDGYFGRKLNNGDIVEIKYIETNGLSGNIDSSNIVTNVVSTIYDSTGIEVELFCTNTSSISGGRNYEDIEDIRVKAPKSYQAGNRAISKNDYESIVDSFSFIKKSTCWGETETNLDKGNLPGTYIPTEENVVHISAVSTTDQTVSTEQQVQIRDVLNEIKSPIDIVVFENVNFIKIKFIVEAFVKDKKYSLSNVTSLIHNTLSNTYSIEKMNFKQQIRYSDYVSLIDGIEGVDYHNTTIQYYKEELFSSAYNADLKPEISNIKPTTVFVYVKNSKATNAAWIKIAHDDGYSNLVGETGYTVSASSINYSLGIGSLVVTSGLTEDFTNYLIRIYFETTIQNIVPTKRYQIVSFGEADIDTQYEVI